MALIFQGVPSFLMFSV